MLNKFPCKFHARVCFSLHGIVILCMINFAIFIFPKVSAQGSPSRVTCKYERIVRGIGGTGSAAGGAGKRDSS